MSRALAILLALAVAAAGLQTYRLAAEQRDHAADTAAHAKQLQALSEAAREAEAAAHAEETRRTAEVQKAADDAQQQIDRARADAAAAADAGQRLRDRLAQLAAACRPAPGHTGPAGAGQAAGTAPDLLADVQRRLDEAQDRIAEFADRAHAAGAACERSYGALTR